MSVSAVVVAFCLASTVVQFDRFVAHDQPLAILPTVIGNAIDAHLHELLLQKNHLQVCFQPKEQFLVSKH